MGVFKKALMAAAAVIGLGSIATGSAMAQQKPLTIGGGLAGVGVYENVELPFWREIAQRHGLNIDVEAFNRRQIRAQEALQIVRRGSMDILNLGVGSAGIEEAEIAPLDLPLISNDTASARRLFDGYRSRLEALLREGYNSELIGSYAYSAQVVWCRGFEFTGMDSLRGKKVRVSSEAQRALVRSFGGEGVTVQFSEMVNEMRRGNIDCAITGALAGVQIGLSQVATHVYAQPITNGVSVIAAHRPTWNALPEAVRNDIRNGLRDMEGRLWDQAARETELGLACASGDASKCTLGAERLGRVTVVQAPGEAVRQDLIRRVVLPQWLADCGGDDNCKQVWNRHFAGPTGVRL